MTQKAGKKQGTQKQATYFDKNGHKYTVNYCEKI